MVVKKMKTKRLFRGELTGWSNNKCRREKLTEDAFIELAGGIERVRAIQHPIVLLVVSGPRKGTLMGFDREEDIVPAFLYYDGDWQFMVWDGWIGTPKSPPRSAEPDDYLIDLTGKIIKVRGEFDDAGTKYRVLGLPFYYRGWRVPALEMGVHIKGFEKSPAIPFANAFVEFDSLKKKKRVRTLR
jgi:hypothetical protein